MSYSTMPNQLGQLTQIDKNLCTVHNLEKNKQTISQWCSELAKNTHGMDLISFLFLYINLMIVTVLLYIVTYCLDQ